MSNKTRYRILIFEFILIILTIFIFTSISYSWVRRDYTPNIKNTKFLKIDTSGAICFIINDELVESISLNDYYNLNTFKLKALSNLHGYNDCFFRVNYDVNGYYYEHLTNTNHLAYDEFGLNNGYIDLRFFLMTNEPSQDIYLSDDSFISSNNPDASSVVRIALSYEENNTTNIILFKKETSDGINNLYHYAVSDEIVDDEFTSHGEPFYNRIFDPIQNKYINVVNDSVVSENQDVSELSDYSLSSGNKLFTVTFNNPIELHLLVWAEGVDPKCIENIINEEVDLFLKFQGISE